MTKVIDCYGHPNTDVERYRLRRERWSACAETVSGTIYLRFGAGERSPIHRIAVVDGVLTQLWAYGSWADRESLTYVTPLDEALAIEE